MRVLIPFSTLALMVMASSAQAQCFACGRPRDPNILEIRSQLTVTVPVADKASPADASKAVDDARRQLSTVMDRELETLKSVYGSDAMLRASSMNSNLQDNDIRGRTAFVSISNTYEIKRPN